jgi:hypothetical protein
VSDSSADPPESLVYLDVDDALEVFGAIIGGTATQAADQLRDRAALAGALARSINYAQYESADLALQAATLAHGIAETQPFIDGNKRAALVVMLTFLRSTAPVFRRAIASWPNGSSPSAPARRLTRSPRSFGRVSRPAGETVSPTMSRTGQF